MGECSVAALIFCEPVVGRAGGLESAGGVDTVWSKQRDRGGRGKVLLSAVLAVLAVIAVQNFFLREAAFRAIDRRELSTGRRLLERVRTSWLPGSGGALLAVRAAMLDGDRQTAERLLGAYADGGGEELDLERVLMRFRSGDMGQTTEWLVAGEERLAASDFRHVLEALIDGSIRSGDEALAKQLMDLWRAETGVEVGEAAAGPEWQQSKLESWLGDLAWSRSLPDVAIVHFRRALELESRNETARLKLGELLLQYGPEEARGHLELLRGLKPENRDVLLRLSACYRELGQWQRAGELLRGMQQRWPEDVLVLLERGRLDLDEGEVESAERWMREAERRAPAHREVLLSLSRCLQLAGRRDDAERYRQMVESLDQGGISGAGAGAGAGTGTGTGTGASAGTGAGVER